MEYKEKLTQKSANDEVKGTAYSISNPEDGKIITEIIFDGTTAKNNYIKAYWLGSTGIYIYPDTIGFGPGAVRYGYADGGGDALFDSYGNWRVFELAVRPVVSLESEVTIDDIKVVNKTEEEWTGIIHNMSALETGHVEEGLIGTDGN